MMFVKNNRDSEAGRNYETGVPPDPKLVATIGKYAEELARTGVLLETGGLLPSSSAARIRARQGQLIVTDGPFIESKEVIGGYAVLKAASKQEAIELGRAFLKIHADVLGPSYEGELEIRQMFDSTGRDSADAA
ncbi:MAG TPA: YciI family protein [Candidatus Saccharimonadales bacterium]|nr:YciI family protein [Candidatus Saccharimonadales bacterium]